MPLPHGFTVTLDRHTRIVDGAQVLLGGSPTRLLRLTPHARLLLSGRNVHVTDRASALLAERLLDIGMAHPVVASLPELPATRHTFVVPVRDRPRELDRLLASIGAGRRIIVVDDASKRPEDVEGVAAKHGAMFLALSVNAGPAGARNAGLRLVTTPYVVFVDSDVVLTPDAVPTLLRHFADPKVAMAVPRITALQTATSGNWLGRYESARSSLDLGTRPAAVRPGSPVSWAPTACVVARVDALGDGFDARMKVGEDVDLCWRLFKGGWRIRYEPTVEAAHEHRVRLGDWFRRKAEYGTGAHPLAERHPEFIAPAVLAPWSTMLVLVLLAQRRWSLPAAATVYGITTVRTARKLSSTRFPLRQAMRLTGHGALASLSQTSALLTRHWWPLTAVGVTLSCRLRRAAVAASVVDVVFEYRRDRTTLDPIRYGIARRLDDLAYGAGVWLSALQGRSTAALRPRVTSRPKQTR